jgi:hypothetical protein
MRKIAFSPLAQKPFKIVENVSPEKKKKRVL